MNTFVRSGNAKDSLGVGSSICNDLKKSMFDFLSENKGVFYIFKEKNEIFIVTPKNYSPYNYYLLNNYLDYESMHGIIKFTLNKNLEAEWGARILYEKQMIWDIFFQIYSKKEKIKLEYLL